MASNQPADTSHQVVILGGGSAGLTVAARLRRRRPGLDIAVIEPSDVHYYQPLWTLVGAGVVRKEKTVRPEASVIPRGVTWLRESADCLDPERNRLRTTSGRAVAYDFLVLAPGIQVDWAGVRGLPDAVGRDGVSSNWSYETVGRTWDFIRDFRGGTALFTLPDTPVKCPGAAQKIMYLADDHFRRSGVRERTRVVFASAASAIFAVEKYARTLRTVLARRGIETFFRHNLVEILPGSRQAVFEHLDTGEHVVMRYDLLHVAPPQSAPDVVRRSPLADARGWAEVDKHSLQSPRWTNVFALGDASSLPIAKTGAAVRHQARVVVENLLAALDRREGRARYDGYTACPVVTGYGKLVLAEFDYEGRPRETFPFDQSKERYSMYLLKKHGLPLLYWQGMLRGRA
ncbi:MAG TPA: FAD/NAD(P)-binding oxidoreductase [Candidatus Eisenbacteria bacterium]|nr:FAD/NAD(P)-binding oxidoreductase [Candidatus Eisenbacteria bacterium]